MASVTREVEQARAHKNYAEALSLAVMEWRRTHASEIADAIDRVAAEALSTFKPFQVKSNQAFHQQWLRAVESNDAVTFAWAASTLGERLDGVNNPLRRPRHASIHPRLVTLFARLDALERHVPHPLVARALSQIVRDVSLPMVLDATVAPYARVLELLKRCRDIRQAGVLQRLVDEPCAKSEAIRRHFTMALPPLIEALRLQKPRPIQDAARWKALSQAQPGPAAFDESRWLNAIVETVGDDTLRMVYADALTERGDARGEFIALQLNAAEAKANTASTKRQRDLLRQHRREWLGELEGVLMALEFKRGFLEEASVARNTVATEQVWARAADDARLGTVRVLEKGNGNAQHYSRFVLSPRMVNLRSAEMVSAELLTQICQGPQRRLEERVLFNAPTVKVLKTIAETKSLPLLERVLVAANEDRLVDSLIPSGILNRGVSVVLPNYGVELRLAERMSGLEQLKWAEWTRELFAKAKAAKVALAVLGYRGKTYI